MEGIKGFTKDLTAVLGEGTFRFEPGGTYEESQCRTGKNGFHFVEYAPDCLSFYPLGSGNRFFLIEAEDVDEEAGGVCCCHKMTLKKELTLKEFAGHAMMYMVRNPRMDWERNRHRCVIAKERAQADCAGAIAVARGIHPAVSGVPGSILGLILEDGAGNILAARVFESQDGKTYTLDADRNLREVQA